MTNYDRVTESPEKLAEFIDNVTYCCGGLRDCEKCYLNECCSEMSTLEWLKEESE